MAEFRTGALGALADEFERSVAQFAALIDTLSDDEYERVLDPETADEDCRSAQTITRHVIGAGYGHAGYVRAAFGSPAERPVVGMPSRADAAAELRKVCGYLAETLEGRWTMPYEEYSRLRFTTRWGTEYDVEQMLEHAVVHVLRHRRQILRLMGRVDQYAR
jgi:hypothetical protein